MSQTTRILSLLCLLLVIAALGPAPTLAQEPLQLRIDQVSSAEFPQVQVDLTVRDADGVPVRGLEAANFEVNEDRQPKARPITALDTAVNPHIQVSVMLVMDVSGSMEGQPLADARSAALRFLDRLEEEDQAAFLALAGQVTLDDAPDLSREAPFTADKTPIYDLLDTLQAKGATPLYDTLVKGVRWTADEPIGNRAVLLLTDGRDEDGRGGPGSAVFNAESPIREANRANIPVYVIGLGEGIDRDFLQRLALETGGGYQETPDSAELAGLFQNVADALKQQYRLTYESDLPADGQEHRLSVTVQRGGRQASDEAGLNTPVGEAPPTATPLPSPTPAPTATPVPTATPTVLAVAAEIPPPEPAGGMPVWLWPLVGVVVLSAIGLLIILTRRRGSAPVEYCRGCGYRLTGPGACPQCGDTHRVTRPKF
jgi:VWFA-related protein